MLGLFSLKDGAGSRAKPAEDASTSGSSVPALELAAGADASEKSAYTLMTCVPVPASGRAPEKGRAPTSKRATNRPAWAFQAAKRSMPASLTFAAEHGIGCGCCTGVQVKCSAMNAVHQKFPFAREAACDVCTKAVRSRLKSMMCDRGSRCNRRWMSSTSTAGSGVHVREATWIG